MKLTPPDHYNFFAMFAEAMYSGWSGGVDPSGVSKKKNITNRQIALLVYLKYFVK